MGERHIRKEEWYPVFEVADEVPRWCPDEFVQIPDDVLERYSQSIDAFLKSQDEMESYYEKQPSKPFDPKTFGVTIVEHTNPFRADPGTI